MSREKKSRGAGKAKWLLFFYTVPSRPVNSRVRIWRRLLKAGAVQLKGAVYILPHSEEHREYFHWLLSEVISMKGDGMVVSIDGIDTMQETEIISLFEKQREIDYRFVENILDDLEKQLSSMAKGSRLRNINALRGRFSRAVKDFKEIRRTDYFSTGKGEKLALRIKHFDDLIARLPGKDAQKVKPVVVMKKSADRYQGRRWVTRKRPFIDRMASAWVIRRFIDRKAIFSFTDEKGMLSAGPEAVLFDIRGGEFTHVGNLCTFEVLIRSFGLRDKPLRKIARIVHDLDMKDEKNKTEEAKGIEVIIEGIRKTALNDHDALEKGMAVFEMLYASES